MFTKLLIANRGEIACRVIRTARRLGIATVAVHSDADANARHVRLADEAVRIGPAPAKESYLSIEAILAAARATGAEAIHPGYGFLSENEAFAEACAAAGIVFVGPPASAIRAMGSKSAAKTLMEKAGVPLTPGYHGDDQDEGRLEREADAIGYPVLIKATAGGGGKGMRRVDAAADFQVALASCRREALNAFGDDRVLVERYVLEPRHIEIQVFADTHGHVVSLFERDCSVQRRHQKVLEEAPAPGMTPERRAAMGQAATEAARAVGYVGAGTVEFIADRDGRFWFMEMNTRLQVEHPVTEMVTGLDLVEWQLRVAAGEPLPRTQDELSIRGHAIEARIYAEDPDRGFLPSTGTLVHLRPPAESAHVRVDTGVEEGDAITPFYDPMIAKLIVHGADRAQALGRMASALAAYRIVGVQHNLAFLARLVATDSFSRARLDTSLIEREHAALFAPPADVPDAVWELAAVAELARERAVADATAQRAADAGSPWRTLDGWRLNGAALRRFAFRAGDGAPRDVVVSGEAARSAAGDAVVAHGDRRHVFHDGRMHVLQRVDRLQQAAAGAEEEGGGLVAPMPGKVIALAVAPGAAVEKGATLLVLEAMKMEHAIVAPRAGRVRAFRCAAGEQVDEGVELVDFEAAEG
jgi:3-methylcrotonyl-CoA carboxylase alpha subunit